MAEQTEIDPRTVFEEDESSAPERPEPEIDYKRIKKHWVMEREGKPFILYSGLLDLLHQESEGAFEITTSLVQAPNAGNDQTAIVSAQVTMAGRTASGIGDANAGNVSRAMAGSTIRMAETRSKARALRDLLNVGLVAMEELGPSAGRTGGFGPGTSSNNGSAGTPQVEGIVVEGQRFTRPQVWQAYQRRMGQMKAAGILLPQGTALPNTAPLNQIVGVTQRLKKALAEAGQVNIEPAQVNG